MADGQQLDPVWAKLDDIQKSIHAIQLSQERQRGDNAVAAQVIAHQAEKHNNLLEVVDGHGKRLDTHDKWRNLLIAFATAFGALGGALFNVIFGKVP